MSRQEFLAAALANVEENDGQLSDEFVKEAIAPPDREAISASVEEVAPADGRPRDESGRFAAKKPEAPIEAKSDAAPANPTPTAEAAPAADRPAPPKSWAADKKAHWDKLDPQIAAYINQREEEQARGVEPLRKVWQGLAPHLDLIQSKGLTPEYVVKDLLDTAVSLDRAAPQDKLAIWMRVGQSYGVPVHLLQGMAQQQGQQPGQVDPQSLALWQELQGVKQHLTMQQQQAEMRVQAEVDSEISAFAQSDSHPHFEALKDTMANLLQSGMASDLDSAYSKALRLHDDLWQQEQAVQRQNAEAQAKTEKDKAAKAAKANAVSTRTATPGAVAAATSGAPKGRRAALEEAFSGVNASRI